MGKVGKASGVQREEHPLPQSSAPTAGMPWAGSRHRDLRAGPPPSAERWEAAEVGWDGKVEDQRPNGCTESWVIRRAGGAGHAAQGSSRPRGRNGKTSGQPQQPAYWAVHTAQGFETNQEGGSGSHLEALTG